jgi:hypothetical protein
MKCYKLKQGKPSLIIYFVCKYIANSKILLVNLPNYEITTSGHFIYRQSRQSFRKWAFLRIDSPKEVGTIIKVSRLYETPAWGFESDAFTIVLVLHTFSSAQKC